jgi:hypothetical protein
MKMGAEEKQIREMMEAEGIPCYTNRSTGFMALYDPKIEMVLQHIELQPVV